MSNVLANVNAQGESLRSEVGSVADCLITIRSFVPGPHERNAFEARVIDGNDKTRVFKRTSTPTARAKRLLVAKAIKLAAEKGYESYDLVDFDLVATEHPSITSTGVIAIRRPEMLITPAPSAKVIYINDWSRERRSKFAVFGV